MTELPFHYSARPRRPPLALPRGERVAFYIAPNVEHFPVGRPAIHIFPATLGCPPDPLNYGWRDYGLRVGLWRVADVLAARNVPASVAVNSAVCALYPEVIEAGLAAGWTWVCHGRDNATFQAGMDEDEERAFLADVVQTIGRTTGTRPRGWLGPALTETFNTPRLLAELGFRYVLDWSNDDEPFPLTVPGMVAVPYLGELSDITVFHLHGGSPDDFTRAVCDHFDRLYLEGAERPSVMGLGVHPFLIGQPGRIGALERALDHILGHPDVWVTTSDHVADWYQATLETSA